MSNHEPDESEWAEWWDAAAEALTPLLNAGWTMLDDETWGDADDGHHLIGGTLRRACSALGFEFEPISGQLQLASHEDEDEGYFIDLLDAPVTIDTRGVDRGGAVGATAGRLGLLDPIHVESAPNCEVTTSEFIAALFADEVLRPASENRGVSLRQAAEALAADREFSMMFDWLMFTGGSRVLPEFVPSAVALAIGGFCWRNNTAVEDEHHRIRDVEMAKTNIAAVRVARQHVMEDGVDWAGLEEALCAPDRRLGDGRRLEQLFAESWPHVLDSVRSQVRTWRRFDEELLGPDAALVWLSVAGASSYMRHWWGQGRWPSIVRTVVQQLVEAGATPPAPYDNKDVEALIRELSDSPDLVPDDVLAWYIDPAVPLDGPRGLRMTDATQPIVRQFYAESDTADEP